MTNTNTKLTQRTCSIAFFIVLFNHLFWFFLFGQVAATGSVFGHLSNPLLVLPLHPPMAAETLSSPPRSAEPKLNNLVGAGYTAFEDSVLMKLRKV